MGKSGNKDSTMQTLKTLPIVMVCTALLLSILPQALYSAQAENKPVTDLILTVQGSSDDIDMINTTCPITAHIQQTLQAEIPLHLDPATKIISGEADVPFSPLSVPVEGSYTGLITRPAFTAHVSVSGQLGPHHMAHIAFQPISDPPTAIQVGMNCHCKEDDQTGLLSEVDILSSGYSYNTLHGTLPWKSGSSTHIDKTAPINLGKITGSIARHMTMTLSSPKF
jgi:hypothetical protein